MVIWYGYLYGTILWYGDMTWLYGTAIWYGYTVW